MDVRTGLQAHPQVRPDVSGPYLPPKTAKDGAGVSDDAVAVPDVLKAGNFVQNIVQTHADIRADVLRASGALEATDASGSGLTSRFFQ